MQKAIEAEFDKSEEQKKAAAEKARKEETEARRKKQCSAARHNLDALNEPGARRLRYPDGSYQGFTADEVRAQRVRAQQQVDDLCKPESPPRPRIPPRPGG